VSRALGDEERCGAHGPRSVERSQGWNTTEPGGLAPRSATSVASVARGGLEGAAASVVSMGSCAKSEGPPPAGARAGD
jgi:hypothetical protein